MQLLLSYLSFPYLPLAITCAVFILLIAHLVLYLRLRKLFKGSDAKSLEPLLKECVDEIARLKKHDELLGDHALVLDKKVAQAVRNVQVLRYKAFESGASNQSFAIAYVNEEGTGVVLSSLHLRDRVSTYAKPVTKYESSLELTEEEKQVLYDAKMANSK